MIKKLTFIIAAIFFASAHAQWTEPVRITYNEGLRSPHIVVVGDTLHVVTHAATSIYYLRSDNSGETWTDPFCPADTFYGSRMPDIAYSNGYLHLVCKLYFEVTRSQIFHFSSADGGRTWSEPHQLFDNDSAFLKYPRLAVVGDTMFASCVIEEKLLVTSSIDGGQTWDDSIEVEAGSISFIQPPNILYSQGLLHLIYSIGDNEDSTGWEICHRRSDDYGQNWSDRVYVSTPENWQEGKDSQGPSAYTDNSGNIIALWFDYKYGSQCGTTGDILGRVSRDNGESWERETRLTVTQTGSMSTCLISNDNIYAVWMDYDIYGCSRPTLMYTISNDWGVSWDQADVIFGPVERNEYGPHLVKEESDGQTTYHGVFWSDPEEELHDPFYFRSAPQTGIDQIDVPLIPTGIELTAYPNPFNSTTMITFNNLEGNDTEIEIFNLLGQRIRSFNVEGAKEGRIVWDATDALGNKVSSGIYFARARASRNSSVIKLIYLK